jgi:hypothetical protein
MASALLPTFTTTPFLNKVFPLQEGLPSAYCPLATSFFGDFVQRKGLSRTYPSPLPLPKGEGERSIAKYFSEVGHKVPWQKLAEDFRDSTFRVQVVDEGEYADQTWRDELKELLERPLS